MTAKRKRIPDRVKLAACLIRIFYITHTQAKTMSVDQILSMAQWDHYPITHADGGSDEPWNLQPLQIRPHLAKTGIDAGTRAKTKRLAAARATHTAKMAAKLDPPSSPRITRPLFKDMKRKIGSRGFQKGNTVIPKRKYGKIRECLS